MHHFLDPLVLQAMFGNYGVIARRHFDGPLTMYDKAAGVVDICGLPRFSVYEDGVGSGLECLVVSANLQTRPDRSALFISHRDPHFRCEHGQNGWTAQ